MAVTERRSAGLDVDRVRADFPILSRKVGDRPLVYLDSAATSQKPRRVLDAERDFYEQHNANVHRGIYMLSEEATELYEGARTKIARFIGATDPDTVIFNRGTTESINAIAHGWGRKFLKEGDEILLTDMEHHSNIVPWQLAAKATGATLRYIPITDEGLLDLSDLGSLLTERTKVFGVTGMSNSLGTLPPVRQLADAAHAVGALLVVDGAQLVPHAPVDVAELGCDFLTISGHKMLGPTASGGFYARRELLEEMDPFIGGGHMILEVFHEYSTWNEVPGKFEGGTMNIAQEVGLAAAVDYLEDLGMNEVRAYEEDIVAYALDRLLDAGARIFGPTDPSVRGGAVSFWYKEIHPHDLATILNEEGIAVRAGHHCNQLVMRRFGVPATTRASFYVYNTKEEVDALVEALGKAESVLGF
ncbi:MAG: SufS family cysteine desulfurase [Actinomycetota bacterium]